MNKFFKLVSYGAIVNFFSAMLGATYLGGDALNGKIEMGRYFLGWHGKFTEVSETVFEYSRAHTISVFILIAMSMLLSVILKPSAADMKWPRRLIVVLGGVTFAYATLKFDFKVL